MGGGGGGGGGRKIPMGGGGVRTIHSSHGTWQYTGKKHVLSKILRYLKNSSKTIMGVVAKLKG